MKDTIEMFRIDDVKKAATPGAPAGVTLVIPAFNEEASIAAVVRRGRDVLAKQSRHFEIIVVDDGSADRTAERALQAGARVIRHPYNRGYGNSLKTGFFAASFEEVVICDADESYPLQQIPLLLEDADKYHMIVGARHGKLFRGGFLKSIGRWLQLALVCFTCGTRVPDANSGFRLIKRSLALRYLDHICAGFSFTTSITIALLCEQYLVKFVSIDYCQRTGRSHVRYLRDTLRSMQIILQSMLRYNPIKAFLLLGLFSFVPTLLFLACAPWWPTALLGSIMFGSVFLLTQAMGMLAYAAGRPHRHELPLDAGLNGWVHEVKELRREVNTEA